MRWERFTRNCAFATVLFLLVNGLEAVRLPGTEAVREYIAFAFTSDWDYQGTLAQAQRGVRTLASYTGRWRRPEPRPESVPAPSAATPPPEEAAVTPEGSPAARPGPADDREEAAPPEEEPHLQWPVRGRITAAFGPRTHPVYRLAGIHEGIDIAAASGVPVLAAADGRITATFRGLRSGLTVDLDHGGFTTRYAHLSAIKVRRDQTVAAGTVIGLVGNTGVTTGSHLHFEVRRGGQPVDPLPLLPR
jgi:murein DD-endopeptidase MepM/ murein hydrolase activator NlpD